MLFLLKKRQSPLMGKLSLSARFLKKIRMTVFYAVSPAVRTPAVETCSQATEAVKTPRNPPGT